MFQLAPLLVVGAVTPYMIKHAHAALYIISGAFALTAKAVFASSLCKHATDSKRLAVCWCFSYAKYVRVCDKQFFSLQIV